MRLQQKAVLFTLPLILVPTLVLGLLSLNYTYNAQSRLERAALQEEVDHRTDVIDSFVQTGRSALVSLVNNIDFQQASQVWAETRDTNVLVEAAQEKVRSFFASYPSTLAVKFYDNNRNLVHVFNNPNNDTPPSATTLLNQYRDWFLIPHEQNGSMALVNQTLWFLNTGKHHSELRTLGFIQLVKQPDWASLLNLKDESSGLLSERERVILADVDANIVLALPRGNLGNELPRPLFNKLKASAVKHTFVSVNDDSNTFNFASRIIDEKYLLFYGTQPSQLLDFHSSYIWGAAITVLLTIILSPVLLHYNFNKFIVGRIERLANAKRQVAQGNLDVKLKSAANDEIGDLFASFNVMVRQLIVYRENERESRLRLEYKVKERTEELEKTNQRLEQTNSELESAKELSEQANELKSAFVANISHEIRTPLTAILGFTEQVLSTEIHSPDQRDLLNRVLKSGRHLLALINDILDLSKIESNKLDLEISEINLFQALSDVESILSAQASDKKLGFTFNFDYPIPKTIRSDATRLKQILFNLISNAIKFTEKGSVTVSVGFDQDQGQVIVKVKDTGIGMTKEVQKRIFAPFVQADVSISRKFGGTGLGLVISNSLAGLLGGNISLESEPGVGSEFTVRFKANGDERDFTLDLVENKDELQEILSEISQDDTNDNTQVSGRVLVAEDVEDNQHLFGLLLRSLNLDYVMVENGQKAVEKALMEDFDLILMDMQMPIMGGLEATKLIRQAGVSTPIYALTANVMTEDVGRHIEAGCSGTIAKPIDKKEFVKVLTNELSGREDSEQEIISSDQMIQLTESYIAQLLEQIALLMSMTEPKDLADLSAECHKIKGSAGSYGFMELTQKASLLERQCLELADKNDDIQHHQWQNILDEKQALIDLANQTISDFRANSGT